MLLKGEIISNLFLKAGMISDNIYNGLEIILGDTL
jgi:hypothetical protein